MNQEKIGIFIANCRKEKNLTQEQLAEKLGISPKSVSRWENGKTMPDYTLIECLTKIFDISMNEFFYGERISEDKVESISEENLQRMFRNKYGKAVKKKFVVLTGIIGGLMSVLIYMLLYLFLNTGF